MNLTGHDIQVDEAKVTQVVGDIKTVSSGAIASAKANVKAAVDKLNTVAEKAGTVPVGSIESIFDEIDSSADQLGAKLIDKVETVRIYSQAGLGKKILSTTLMAGVNIGEGFLSVADDIMDVFTGIGAGACALFGFKSGAEFLKKQNQKDFSHDLANIYYKSDLAKASAFTEDSAIAGALKIAGKTAGYLYAGGVASKAFTAGKYLSATTKGATLMGGITGFGAGVENGLKSGKSTKDALIEGGIAGVTQAGVSLGAGLVGQAAGKLTSGASGAGKSFGQFEGYPDVFTKAGQNTTLSGIVSGIKSAPGAIVSGVKSAPGAIVSGVKSAPGAIKGAIKSAPSAIVSGVKSVPGAIGAVAPVIPGVVAQGYRAKVNSPEYATPIANEVFESTNNGNTQAADPEDNNKTPDPDSTQDQTQNPDSGNSEGQTNPNPGPSGGGGGSAGGGGGDSSSGESGTPNYQDPIPPKTPTPTPTKDPIKNVELPKKAPESTPTPTNEPIKTPTPVPETNPVPEPIKTTIENPIPQETVHTGEGYTETPLMEETKEVVPEQSDIGDIMGETTTSIDDIIKGNKYTKIPTSSSTIKKPTTKGSGSTIIPIAAGLSAAAAAGIGAKAYMDRKNNSDNEEEEYEDDWSDNEPINLNYTNEEIEDAEEATLTDDDVYEGEKYGARSNDELADLQ